MMLSVIIFCLILLKYQIEQYFFNNNNFFFKYYKEKLYILYLYSIKISLPINWEETTNEPEKEAYRYKK